MDFDIDITTPIYRIINHVDIVPRLPNPTLVFLIRYSAVLIGVGLDMVGGLSKTIRNSAWYKKFSQSLTDAQNTVNPAMAATSSAKVPIRAFVTPLVPSIGFAGG